MFDLRRQMPPFSTALTAFLCLATLTTATAAPRSKKEKKRLRRRPPRPRANPAAPMPSAPPSPAVPEAPPLTAEQMGSAVSLDAMTVPTPGELFAALNKQCKPNWISEYRGPIGTAYSDRPQAALNLGGLIADGYIAVEAQDGQQVKNLGRDILALSKTLGISKDILARGNSIQQFADGNDWNSLKETLEALQNEVKLEMDNLHDDELVTLLNLGGWIRGTQVVSDVVLKNFSQETSCILRQPALVGYLRGKLDKLSPKVKDAPLVKRWTTGSMALGKLVSFPSGRRPPRKTCRSSTIRPPT